MRALIWMMIGALLGSAATFWYFWDNYADAADRSQMHDLVTTFAPFMAEYLEP